MGKEKARVFIDEAVFAEIAKGDSEAMRSLYEHSYRPIFALLLSLTHNYHDAEDLLQETYIKIRQGAHLYRPGGSPMAWMMKIARNLYISANRSKKNRTLASIEEISCDIPFENIKDTDDRLYLKKLFDTLGEEERTIIILHLVSGMKFREISSILDRPLGTVLSVYNRGLKKMKKSAEVWP